MNLRWALSWDGHVCAIEHWLFCRHVVIDDLQDDVEFSHHDLALIFLITEECETLAHPNTMDVCELAHHLSKVDHTLSEQARTSISLVALVSDDEGGKLELHVLDHLTLSDRQVERVRRKDRVLDGGGDVGTPLVTIAV